MWGRSQTSSLQLAVFPWEKCPSLLPSTQRLATTRSALHYKRRWHASSPSRVGSTSPADEPRCAAATVSSALFSESRTPGHRVQVQGARKLPWQAMGRVAGCRGLKNNTWQGNHDDHPSFDRASCGLEMEMQRGNGREGTLPNNFVSYPPGGGQDLNMYPWPDATRAAATARSCACTQGVGGAHVQAVRLHASAVQTVLSRQSPSPPNASRSLALSTQWKLPPCPSSSEHCHWWPCAGSRHQQHGPYGGAVQGGTTVSCHVMAPRCCVCAFPVPCAPLRHGRPQLHCRMGPKHMAIVAQPLLLLACCCDAKLHGSSTAPGHDGSHKVHDSSVDLLADRGPTCRSAAQQQHPGWLRPRRPPRT